MQAETREAAPQLTRLGNERRPGGGPGCPSLRRSCMPQAWVPRASAPCQPRREQRRREQALRTGRLAGHAGTRKSKSVCFQTRLLCCSYKDHHADRSRPSAEVSAAIAGSLGSESTGRSQVPSPHQEGKQPADQQGPGDLASDPTPTWSRPRVLLGPGSRDCPHATLQVEAARRRELNLRIMQP